MIKVCLSSIIDVISGGTPKTKVPEYWGGNIGWLSVTDFNNDLRFVYDTEKKITERGVKESNTKFLNIGDIIISARGTVGALAQIGKPMCFNQSCFGIRGKKNIADTDFLYYSLKNYVKNIVKRSQGSVFDTINLKSFDLMVIEIPKSISTQKKIAKVLSDLDAKKEVNNKINQELEAMAKTLYDYWFVQFDFPDKNGKPYKSSGGKMVFNEELKREIPAGWEYCLLGDVVSKTGTGLNPRKHFALGEGENYYVTIKNINQGQVVLDHRCDKISDKSLEIINNRSDLRIGDILYTSIEPVGITYLLRSKPKNWNINESVFTIRADYEKVSSEFLYMFLSGDYIKAYTKNVSAGSIHKGVRHGTLKECKFILPKKDIVDSFTNKIIPVLDKLELIQKENQKLSELRDWLLPMLMNGQVSVGYAEQEVERLQVAAEPTAIYKTQETNLSNLFPTLNYDYEIATIVWKTQQKLGKEFGKKYIQKTLSNIQFLSTLPKIEEIVFKEHYWGMFSAAIEKAVQNKQFIKFKRIDFGREVIELNMKHLVNVSKWTKQEGYNKEFTEQVNQMLDIYSDSLIDSDMNRIELLNTVLECIKVLKTYDFESIYNKMKTWKMEEDGYKTKADKFRQEETRLMIELVMRLKRK